jgi:putative transposase
MDDFINKLCSTLLRAKPEWIMVEELVVKDLLETDLSTHEHHDIVQKSNWYKFRETLTKMAVNKHCTIYEVPKYYPSSRKCHLCGHKNKADYRNETIKCKKCGEKYDRDVNAAINLYNYKKSKASILEVDFVVD